MTNIPIPLYWSIMQLSPINQSTNQGCFLMVHVSRTVRISVAEHLVRLAFSKVHTIRRGSLASTPKAIEGLKGGTTCIILSTAIFTDSMVIFSGHKFASKCVANTKIYQDWMLQHFQSMTKEHTSDAVGAFGVT
jgi:hypothetical protein